MSIKDIAINSIVIGLSVALLWHFSNIWRYGQHLIRELAHLGHEKEVVDSWWKLKCEMLDRITSPSGLTNNQWRGLLINMNFKWIIGQEDNPVMMETASTASLTKAESDLLRKSTIELGLPIKEPLVLRNIVLASPGRDQHFSYHCPRLCFLARLL